MLLLSYCRGQSSWSLRQHLLLHWKSFYRYGCYHGHCRYCGYGCCIVVVVVVVELLVEKLFVVVAVEIVAVVRGVAATAVAVTAVVAVG